jgi:hypothetical protein
MADLKSAAKVGDRVRRLVVGDSENILCDMGSKNKAAR